MQDSHDCQMSYAHQTVLKLTVILLLKLLDHAILKDPCEELGQAKQNMVKT
jgi:hypothetical protein